MDNDLNINIEGKSRGDSAKRPPIKVRRVSSSALNAPEIDNLNSRRAAGEIKNDANDAENLTPNAPNRTSKRKRERTVAAAATTINNATRRSDFESKTRVLSSRRSKAKRGRDEIKQEKKLGSRIYELKGYTTIGKINRKYQTERQQYLLRKILATIVTIIMLILLFALYNPFKDTQELRRAFGIDNMFEQTTERTRAEKTDPSIEISDDDPETEFNG